MIGECSERPKPRERGIPHEQKTTLKCSLEAEVI